MKDNSIEFWNNEYWKNVINDNKTDFLNECWLDKYIDKIDKVENKIAVDLGCGIGQDTKWLIDKGFKVTPCDFSQRALNKLKELIPNVKTMQIDIKEKLPFKDNSIGLVNANLSIHYFNMENTIKIFQEVYRILKTNGLFVGRVNSDKNEEYIKEEIKKIEENFYCENGRFRRLFNKEQFNVLTKNWNTIILKEDTIIRINRKKVLWEFILKK